MPEFDPQEYFRRVLNPALEEYRRTGELPDVFARYDLPLEVSNPDEIRSVLQRTFSFWCSNKNNSKYGTLLAVLCSDKEHKGAERILLDPPARDLAREDAENRRRKRAAARFAELDNSIDLIVGKGYVTPEELSALLARYVSEKGFPEAEVRERLKRVPVKAPPKPPPAKEGLPKEVRTRLKENLAVLGLADLYQFLKIRPPLTRAKLSPRYQECEREWRPKPNDHRKTCANELLAIIKLHLIDGDPERYEQARCWEVREQLRGDVALAAADKRITEHEYGHLAKMATDRGLDAAAAEECIRSLAAEMGAALELASTESTLRCAGCLNSFPAQSAPDRCPVCNHELWRNCPKCGTRAPLGISTCGNCRFTFDDYPRLQLLIRQAELALADSRVSDALETAREAEQLWGARDGPVDELFRKIEGQQGEILNLRVEFEKALFDRRLYKARAHLAALSGKAPGFRFADGKTLPELEARLEGPLKQVEACLEEARSFERRSQPDEAILSYEKALSLAQDCEEARRGLARHPPLPPGKVTASFQGDHVLVEWLPSPTKGTLEYVVVRQESRAPTAVGDGRQLERTPTLVSRDTSAPPGATLYYSVFTDRWGTHSRPASSAGVFSAVEVANLTLKAGDGSVTAAWSPVPPGARVRALRKENSPPASHQDGVRVKHLDRDEFFDGFVDTAVRNGCMYYYLIWVEYKDPSGRALATPGRVERARPEAPAAAVNDLRLVAEERGLGLVWTAPPGGSVRIYRASKPPQGQPGTQVSLSGLSALGAVLSNQGATRAVDPSPPSGICYYIPATLGPDFALLGAWRRYVALPDVSGLEALDFTSYVRLFWDWPAGCDYVWVAWRGDAYPEAPDAEGVTAKKCTREEYQQQGYFEIAQPSPGPQRFTVFTGGQIEGQEVHSSGIGPGCRAELRTGAVCELAYTLTRGKGFYRRQVIITLTASKDVRELPDLAIVAHKGDQPPRTLEDGEMLEVLRELGLPAGIPVEREIELTRTPVCLRAFFRDPKEYRRYRLAEPPPAQLQMR